MGGPGSLGGVVCLPLRHAMRKALIWVPVSILGLAIVAVTAMVVLLILVDVQRWKPDLEARLSEAMGHRVSIEGDIGLTLLPLPEVRLSGIHVANPEWPQRELLEIGGIRIKASLVPLVLGRIEVRQATIEGPRLVLARDTTGRWSWEGRSRASAQAPATEGQDTRPSGRERPLKKGLAWSPALKELLLTGGTVTWMDAVTGARHDLKDLMVRISDLSAGQTPQMSASGTLHGHRISVEGYFGPLSSDFLRGDIPVDIAVQVAGRGALRIQGKISGPWSGPRFDLSLQVPPLSPRGILRVLGQDRIVNVDPEVLRNATLEAVISGDLKEMTSVQGVLHVDHSTLTFSGRASWASGEDLELHLVVDQADLDAYLPPRTPRDPAKARREGPGRRPGPGRQEGQGSSSPWAKFPAHGDLRVGVLRFGGARFEDVFVRFSTREGILSFNSMAAKGYEGSWTGKGLLDSSKERPRAELEVSMDAVKLGPMLRDIARKEALKGTLEGHLALHAERLDLDDPLRSLQGRGDLSIRDGAILGLDLADKVRHALPSGRRETKDARPETRFSELRSVFEISGGILETKRTWMTARGLRIHAKGKANLVEETLELRLEPELAADPREGKRGEELAALAVPVLVTGKFSSPTFQPDLEGISKGKGRVILRIPSRERLKEYLKSLPK